MRWAPAWPPTRCVNSRRLTHCPHYFRSSCDSSHVVVVLLLTSRDPSTFSLPHPADTQVALSLVDRRVLREVSDLATEGGVALVGYGVLCGGLLHERWVGQREPAPTQLPRPSQRAAKRALDAWGDWAAFQGLLVSGVGEAAGLRGV